MNRFSFLQNSLHTCKRISTKCIKYLKGKFCEIFCDGSNKVILEASAGKDLLGNYIVQQIICDYFKK